MTSAKATMPAMSAPVKARAPVDDGEVDTPEVPEVPEPVVAPEVTGAPTVSVSTGEVEPL
jgi:hypothetical protein